MHVFISPHYDDAVYSCGGTIHRLSREGVAVTILTTMGGEPPTSPPDTPLIRDLHQRWAAGENPIHVRQQEDREAAAAVGAEVRQNQTLTDCVYRVDEHTGEALYPTEASLWGCIHPQDGSTDWLVAHRFTLSDDDLHHVRHIYVPLGAGEHVDHLIVREAAVRLLPVWRTHSIRVWFYPDYPYSEDKQAVRQAVTALPDHVRLKPIWCELTSQDVEAKIAGAAAHRSQMSTFWADVTTLKARIRAASQHEDRLTELFFELV